MNWSAEQRRLLDALGYEVLAHGRAAPAPPQRAESAGRPAPAPAAPSPRSGGDIPARLLEALRRAANGADPGALVDDLDALRRDPLLKRALWPRLRALRRRPS